MISLGIDFKISVISMFMNTDAKIDNFTKQPWLYLERKTKAKGKPGIEK
jgi:hypothetical protein